jgi:hypothetical protein
MFTMPGSGWQKRLTSALNQCHELFTILARGFLAGNGAEENRQLGDEFFVFEHVIGDPPGIHSGEVEEFEPVVRALLEAELFGPGAEGIFVARRRKHFAFDLAPIAGVVAVFETEFAQAQALSFPDLFYEFAKRRFDFMLWLIIYHSSDWVQAKNSGF